MGDTKDRQTKLAALRERIVPAAKPAELVAVARELEALGEELARDERTAAGTSDPITWPRDLNESPERPASEWGSDPGAEDANG